MYAYFTKKDGLQIVNGTDKMWRAGDLNARLTYLALVGVTEDGELEWCGTEKEWDMVGGPVKKTDYFKVEFMNGEDDFNIEYEPAY